MLEGTRNEKSMDILVIDIGGNSVKLWHTAQADHLKFSSGKSLTPDEMVTQIKDVAKDWTYEAIAMGIPTRVSGGRIVEDPPNLAPGWVGFHYSAALECPIRMLNDACLQALGSYDGGRMLFLGLGTGVGSALISERLVLSLDMGRIHFEEHRLFELLGDEGFEELGVKKMDQNCDGGRSLFKARHDGRLRRPGWRQRQGVAGAARWRPARSQSHRRRRRP